MTDILEQYKYLKFSSNPSDLIDFADNAAAEIRALREGKKTWQNIASMSHDGEHKALREVERLKIQVQELKEAFVTWANITRASEMPAAAKKVREALAKLGGEDD